ncbi:hypothetical protein H9P43_004443 [Blastocladiella emersonii ATCC 22665]|nr:hypothetical protein H9P43_004443 [Blastocladiella emersonii ATCC 22665]
MEFLANLREATGYAPLRQVLPAVRELIPADVWSMIEPCLTETASDHEVEAVLFEIAGIYQAPPCTIL